MADVADCASEEYNLHHDLHLAKIRRAAADIPAGVAGVCGTCGFESPRLVRGNCAPCRDEFGLD